MRRCLQSISIENIHTQKFNKKQFQSNGAADAVEFYVQLRIRYGRLNEATKKHSKRKLNLKFEVAEKKWKN